jgi:hypothetical protein
MVWSAIVVGIAVAAGILALGFIVLAVAAAIGLVSWILFAVLRRFDSRFGDRFGNRHDDRRPDIEIITARGETLDGGDLGVVPDDDSRSPRR